MSVIGIVYSEWKKLNFGWDDQVIISFFFYHHIFPKFIQELKLFSLKIWQFDDMLRIDKIINLRSKIVNIIFFKQKINKNGYYVHE